MRETNETRLERCEVHGEYVSRLVAKTGQWTRCWSCVEAELQALDARAQADDAAQQGAARREQRIAESGLEGRMLRATFSSYTARRADQCEVLEACKTFAESVDLESGRNLWLVGGVGTGKTHLGAAMVTHFIHERDTSAAILSAREIIRVLRATWGRNVAGDAETEIQVIDRLGRMGLLVLDEIGAGFSSDAERVQLFDVIDMRYKLGRPTVVLSNLTAKDMKPILGERTFDRLREGATLLTCSWPSHRAEAVQ
ncbi:ATP-binding protein [Delftia acidovorans]|uniref:ATP-binding protein n=1 Tax=Delftia acidovorans TaxID=80866 RepID=UPI003D120582